MKTTTVDSRSRDKMRRIELEEDFREGANLTKLQQEWAELYEVIEHHVFRKRVPLEHMVIAFRPGRFGKKRLNRFDETKPIVKLDQVTVAFLNPIDARYWKTSKPGRRYRLNYSESRLRRVSDGGDIEIWASSSDDESDFQKRLPQKDAFKRPLQDHYRFDLHEYSPNQLVNNLKVGDKIMGDPRLMAPRAGKFELVRDQSHCNVMIDGLPVFRMLVEDAKDILTHAQDEELAEIGSQVSEGDPLICMQDRTFYGVLKFRRDNPKIPDIDRISGDVFCASNRRNGENLHSLRLAVSMLRRIVWAITEDSQCPSPSSMSEWAPRHLLEFNAEHVWTFPLCEQWRCTPELRDQLLRAVSPKGGFYLRAEIDAPTTVTEVKDDGKLICYGDGSDQPIPKHARILESVKVGVPGIQVEPGTPIADWVPREFHDWSYMENLPYLGLVLQHFLREIAVVPGTYGYEGSGLLLPANFIPGTIRSASTCPDYLDFQRTLEYAEDGTFVGPPMRQMDWTDFVKSCDGIMYNAEPMGEFLLTNPVVVVGNSRK